MGLKGSKTEQNLKDAFAGESQANRRYLYFANKADIEGQNEVARGGGKGLGLFGHGPLYGGERLCVQPYQHLPPETRRFC